MALALEGRSKAARGNADLVAIADVLSALPEPEIDRNFALALEARLMTEGLETAPRHLHVVKAEPAFPETPADEIVRVAPVVQMPRRRMVVRRSVAAGVAAAMLGAFPLVAAAQSLPGSPFYGLKTRIEKMQIAMFGNAVQDGFSYGELAQRRIAEATQLAGMHADQTLIAATYKAATDDLNKMQSLILGNTTDPAALRKLSSMAAESERQIANAPAVTGGAQMALNATLSTTQAIQTAVARALGLPVAQVSVNIPAATIAGPSNGAAIATNGSGTQGSQASSNSGSGTNDSPVKSKDGGDTGKGNGGGDGDDLTGGQGCAVAGSANGLGDLLSPLTMATCTD